MLELNGCRVLESCHLQKIEENDAFLTEHFLVYVFSGKIVSSYQGEEFSAGAGEAIFVRKAQHLHYKKIGFIDGATYQSLLFAFTNDLIKEFFRLKKSNFPFEREASQQPFFKINPNREFLSFIETIRTYAQGNLAYEPELLRLKILEMLFVLTDSTPQVANYLFQFSHPEKDDLVKVMENNFTQPATVADFAYLAGRSISSFKRDFQSVFGSSSARWLREKRLELARKFLLSTDKSVTDVCFEVGFENASHFSRAFKEHFGYHPSNLKKRAVLQKSLG
jgi:AraC family transcriptional regulator, exoenzyme S synthesis regulatory protein ExsA